MFQFYPMQEVWAKQIVQWRYQPPFDVYNVPNSPECLQELMGAEYYAVLDNCGSFWGMTCLGNCARIPAKEPDPYPEQAMDFGIGMPPDKCGKGRGLAFVTSCVDFWQSASSPALIRLSVAAFNRRAIIVYERAGFEKARQIHHGKNGAPFWVMLRREK